MSKAGACAVAAQRVAMAIMMQLRSMQYSANESIQIIVW